MNILEAKQNVIRAVLYLIYVSEASGGRLTTDDSAGLDYAQDQFDRVLEDYVKAVTDE